MPNWCSCSISLPGETAAEARATLSEVLARYAFDQPQIPYMQGGRHFQPPPERVVRFDRIHPFPPAIDPRGRPVGFDHPSRHWAIENWGTNAWGFYPKLREASGREASLFIDCKWSPCVGVVGELSRKYPAVPWLVEWSEERGPQAGFVGWALFHQGRCLARVSADLWSCADLRKKVYGRRCEACGAAAAEGKTFNRCARCKSAFYCGPECQKNHWETHKRECPALAQQVVEDAALSARIPAVRPAGLAAGALAPWSVQAHRRVDAQTRARVLRLLAVGQTLTARGVMTKDVWVRVVLPLAVGVAPPRKMAPPDVDRHVRGYTGPIEEYWRRR